MGKNAQFHAKVFKMCQISRKFHGRSLRNSQKNSRAPQPLFRGAMLMQRNLSNSTFEISEQRIFIIVINVSQDSRLGVSK